MGLKQEAGARSGGGGQFTPFISSLYCGSPLPSPSRGGGRQGVPSGRAGAAQPRVTPPAGQQGGLGGWGRQAMEAPSTGPEDSAWRSVEGPGLLLAGAELEVIIHGDVGGQHLQIQTIDVLREAGGG